MEPPVVPPSAARTAARRYGPPPPYERPPPPPPEVLLGKLRVAGDMDGEGGDENDADVFDSADQHDGFPPPQRRRRSMGSRLGKGTVALLRALRRRPTARPAAAAAFDALYESPWQWLPVELLEAIVLRAAAGADAAAGPDAGVLLATAGVCRHWRSAVTASPVLWREPRLDTLRAAGLVPFVLAYGGRLRAVRLRNRELPSATLRALFARKLPHVQEVDLRGTTKFTTPVLKALAKACPGARTLLVTLPLFPANLRSDGLAALKRCKHLWYLNLSESYASVVDPRPEQPKPAPAAQTGRLARRLAHQPAPPRPPLAQSSRRLGGFARQLTDSALTAIVGGCPALEEVYLSGCTALTDRGVAALTRLRRLRVLDLSFCQQLPLSSLRDLTAACATLQVLYAVSLGLSPDDVAALVAARPTLRVVTAAPTPAPAPSHHRRAPAPS